MVEPDADAAPSNILGLLAKNINPVPIDSAGGVSFILEHIMNK